ncbi:MAG TPA: ATPase domain-containing protein, partial [Allomuricauda sp.]|nr:ATPase domain-containing protein [Allomuricauda sp.]
MSVIEKIPSGIPGFDEVTNGGLPRGRPTLVCGDAGAGKTMFGMQFLINGVSSEQEPGIFVAFEESENDLKENMASLGWDLNWLCQEKKMAVEAVKIS